MLHKQINDQELINLLILFIKSSPLFSLISLLFFPYFLTFFFVPTVIFSSHLPPSHLSHLKFQRRKSKEWEEDLASHMLLTYSFFI